MARFATIDSPRASLLAWAPALLACVPNEDPELGEAQTESEDSGESDGGDEDELVTPILLNDNGAWSWFMDDRVIVRAGQLVVGSVRSLGLFDDTKGLEGWGNVEVATLDLETRAIKRAVLHPQFEQDDHDNPAFLPLADGGLLAVYTKAQRRADRVLAPLGPGRSADLERGREL